eukprot:gene20971-15477_t
MHFFTVENVRWRALPKEYGNWNTVWKRFERLSKAGVFEAFFDALASMSPSAHLIQMFDSTIVRGEASDGRHFETLMNIGPDIAPRAIVADKGYASKANRAAARARGIAPVIPHKANEKNKPAFFAKTIYKGRGRIEQAFGRLKRFKRVALRCEKTAQNFASI